MRLRGFVAATAAVCVMAGAVAADAVNLLEGYGAADWQGDTLSYDSASGAVFFGNEGGTEKSAVMEITAEGTGLYFSIDAGNGVNTADSGYCILEFFGEEGQALSSFSTGGIAGLENYSRFYVGSEENYYPLPEGTKKIAVSLHAAPKGNSGRINVYFRNLTLCVSDEKPLTAGEDSVFMKSITGLTKVEVGLDSSVRWIWIGIVFAVAMAFYIVRMWRERYRTAEVMKAGKKKL